MKNKERLDVIIVDNGLVKSRERAKALIMEGKVIVNGVAVIKAGTLVSPDSDIVLKKRDIPYVGRGGLKLTFRPRISDNHSVSKSSGPAGLTRASPET